MPGNSKTRPEAARFLLVDSDVRRAGALAAALAMRTGTPPARLAGSGWQAAAALRAGRYEVLLLDLVSLTDLAAPAEEAVTRLVKLAEGALTVGLSDGASVTAAVETMRAGAHDCLARPVAAAALAARIAELAHRHGKEGAVVLPGIPSFAPDAAASPRLAPPAAPSPILPMWRQEQRIIEDAIASFAGNIALAAAALELSPSTIYRKRQAWAEAEGKRGAA
jgi:DNA-binding NtrC family response regulator